MKEKKNHLIWKIVSFHFIHSIMNVMLISLTNDVSLKYSGAFAAPWVGSSLIAPTGGAQTCFSSGGGSAQGCNSPEANMP